MTYKQIYYIDQKLKIRVSFFFVIVYITLNINLKK
jgi:hypothetical protein